MKHIFLFLISSLFSINANYNEPFNAPWGVDGELAYTKQENVQAQKAKLSIEKRVCVGMIRFFQQYISPIDGPRSSFYPTSSQYALEAISKYGIFTGIALGCDRLLRENSEAWVYNVTDKHGIARKLDPVR